MQGSRAFSFTVCSVRSDAQRRASSQGPRHVQEHEPLMPAIDRWSHHIMAYPQPPFSPGKLLAELRSVIDASALPVSEANGVDKSMKSSTHGRLATCPTDDSIMESLRDQVVETLKSYDVFDWIPALVSSRDTAHATSGVNPFPNKLVKPRTLEDIQKVVKDARRKGLKVRVIGAAHSSPPEIILDIPDPDKVVLLSLTNYRGVTVDHKGFATVKAGTNLGQDPGDPDSTLDNSFAKIVDDLGWAIPETGGIIHQTVGGFLQTGSAGGSLVHGFHDAIVGFRLVTGTGEIKILMETDDDPSAFYAAGVSMGLYGIITDVYMQLEPTYLVQGTQQAYDAVPGGSFPPPVDIFGDAKVTTPLPDLNQFFKLPQNEYCRMMWWPQPDFSRVQIWSATRVPRGSTPPTKPYVEITETLQHIAKVILAFLWQATFNGRSEFNGLAAILLNLFVPAGPDNSLTFSDKWYNVLPMDNSVDDLVLPTCFNEIWIDPEHVDAAMQVCRELHIKDPGSIGNFFTEIYTAKESKFWLSPSFSRPKIRLDVNFFQYDTEPGNFLPPWQFYPPELFFVKYWNALDQAGIPYTTHWGKYRPDSQCNVAYLRQQYPNYDKWMKLREEMDPDQMFVTPYWRKHLQIPARNC
ncbi:putative D-arabinono-1,4-lactone oxidase [Lyophyllum shimeji]|uniref:D-arabinono-1,4-lactone oxidase n=1 Tax=Lyophyllum shimeji TaxID=47721 RepID=A0A9P3PX53_LYOSH|nr:putative D-arabinono-1,4-lactone oxidase [Lyophyllum shimeji]